MSNAESIIADLSELNASLMPPASPEDLESILYSEVPADYRAFLRLANGAQAAGLCLYGTVPQTLAGGQLDPDLIMATQQAVIDRDLPLDSLEIGYQSGGLTLQYNGQAAQYEVLDSSTSYELYQSYPSLRDLVAAWANLKRDILERTRRLSDG